MSLNEKNITDHLSNDHVARSAQRAQLPRLRQGGHQGQVQPDQAPRLPRLSGPGYPATRPSHSARAPVLPQAGPAPHPAAAGRPPQARRCDRPL